MSIAYVQRSETRAKLEAIAHWNKRKWMKSSELRDSFTFRLTDSSDVSKVELFEFLANGKNRLVYASTDSPTVAKLLPLHDPKGDNQNLQEYSLYEAASGIQDIIPRCHGLLILNISGWEFQVLLCDRVAFTLTRILQEAHSEPVTGRVVAWITRSLLLVVEALTDAAVNRKIVCSDWHSDNIGFTDDEPPNFVLLDWVNHNVQTGTSARTRMKIAFDHFIRYLAIAPPLWQSVMHTLKTILSDWFTYVQAEGPSPREMELLRSRFATAIRNATTDQEHITSYAAAKASSVLLHHTTPRSSSLSIVEGLSQVSSVEGLSSNPTNTASGVGNKSVIATNMPSSNPTRSMKSRGSDWVSVPTKTITPAKRSCSSPTHTPAPSITDNNLQLWPPTLTEDAWTHRLVRQGFVGAAAIRSLSSDVQILLASWQADGPLHGSRTKP